MVTMTHKRLFSGPKIALYEPDIPQNTASIIRTCSCLGAHLEIIEPCGFLFNDKRFKRVVMDYLDEKMITFYKDSEDFFAKKKGERVILMTTKAKTGLDVFKFKKSFSFYNEELFIFGMMIMASSCYSWMCCKKGKLTGVGCFKHFTKNSSVVFVAYYVITKVFWS